MCFGCLEPRSAAEWLQLTKIAHKQKTVFERASLTTHVISKPAHEHWVGRARFDENGGKGKTDNTWIVKRLAK